jgi:outer membrane protein assembly factor BamB
MVTQMRWKKHVLLIALVIAGIILLAAVGRTLPGTVSGDDWVCFKGSPERTSSSDDAAPNTCLLEWCIDVKSELYSSPVVKNGNVFQVALDNLYCIDLSTGDVLWVSDVPVYQSTPFVASDRIIVTTNRGISALSPETGEILWEYVVSGRFREILPLRDYIVSSPAVASGKVIVGTMPYSYYETDPYYVPDEIFLVCVEETTGKEGWYMETWYGVHSSPCSVHGKVFAASREMVCVDIKTGEVVWNTDDIYPYDLKEPIYERYAFSNSTPALYHGVLVAGSSAAQWEEELQDYLKWQKIVFIDQYTAEVLWEWGEEGRMASSPAVYQGKVYMYSFDGMLRCISFLEGDVLWETAISKPKKIEFGDLKIKEPLWPSPTVADGKVYIGSIEGVIYCLDAETGEVLWTYLTGGEIRSAPAVVDGKVLIPSTDGKLYCFGIDPDTYFLKAQNYLENGEIEKAQQFLVKAKEHAKTEEEITRIENFLTIVDEKMPEYKGRMEKIKKAESHKNEADNILWDKKFRKAHDLYGRAYAIFQEVDDEFGEALCMERMEYITQRMPEETTEIPYWPGILALCGVVACLVIWRRRKSHE